MKKLKLPKSNLPKYEAIESETKQEIAQLETALSEKKDELEKIQTLISAYRNLEDEKKEVSL